MSQRTDQNNRNDKQTEDVFIREYTKAKPVSKKAIAKKVLGLIIAGLILGGAFGLGQYAVKQVLPDQEAESDDATKPAAPIEEPVVVEPEDVPETEPQEPEQKEPLSVDVDESDEQKGLTLEDYQSLKYEIYQVGRRANHSIVTVTGTNTATDVLDFTYEDENQAVGLVLSNDGKKLEILTGYESIQNARNIQVMFENGDLQEAELVGYNGILSLAIVSVSVESLQPETLNDLAVSELNKDAIVAQGQIVIAAGRPLGSMYSVLDGTVTSNNEKIRLEDGNYNAYGIDLGATSQSGAILVNTDGQVIGLLNRVSASAQSELLTVFSAKDLELIVDKMRNGETFAYLGVTFDTITDDLSDAYNIPTGVYVNAVTVDSPAMVSGMKPGDIIVSIDKQDITTDEAFMAALFELQPEQTVEIGIMRAGTDGYSNINLEVTLGSK